MYDCSKLNWTDKTKVTIYIQLHVYARRTDEIMIDTT